MNIDHLTTPPEMPAGLTMIRRIGSGGAGNIFMVRDITGKLLALKSIDPRWQQKELDSVTSLRNLPADPAVTQIYQTGQLSDGSFFYTMELADNAGDEQLYIPDTLAHRIGSGKLSAADTLSVIRDVTIGVMHLHEHRLFHGDIKPENIIFINGQAKISDFGTLSGSGNAGTAGFIPDDPVSEADRDCYALAKTLYCAYSGCDASDFPSPPEKFNADEFRIVRRLYMAGCAGQAGKRFASAADWKNALDQAIDQIARPHKPAKLWIRTAIFSVIILLLSGIALIFSPVGKKTEVPPDKKIPAATRSADPPAPATEPTMAAVNLQQPQQISSTINPQYSYAASTVSFSRSFNGEFASFPDFRKKFEAVYREMPDKLDNFFCEHLTQYYADLDRFLQLREQLSAQDNTPEKLFHDFVQNNYQTLFNRLRHQNSVFPSTWEKQFQLVQQLYETIGKQKLRKK